MSHIPSDVLQLSSELEQQGHGGDTRVGWMEVVCRVTPSASRSPVAWVDGSQVVIRNPSAGPAANGGGQHQYRLSAALGPSADEDTVHAQIGSPLVDWVWAGFNASVIAYGESSSGKTHTLFGRGGCDPALTATRGTGLCGRILTELYRRASGATPATVGLSCWQVCGDTVEDLLGSGKIGGHDYVTAAAPDLDTANQLLNFARRRSSSWTDGRGEEPPSLRPNRAHMVVRVVLHRENRVSCIHVVDLAGFQPLGLGQGNNNNNNNNAASEQERAAVQRDLSSFSRIIAELARHDVQRKSHQDASETLPRPLATSAFTHLLGPLMGGNSKTFLLACVHDGAEHFKETIQTLRVASRVLAVASACSQLVGLRVEDLELRRASTILPGPPSAVVAPAPQPSEPSVVPPPPPPPLAKEEEEEEDKEEEEETEAWLERYNREKNAILSGSGSGPPAAPSHSFYGQSADELVYEPLSTIGGGSEVSEEPHAGSRQLLQIIQDDQGLKERQQRQVEELQLELQEKSMAHEIETEDLRRQVRTLTDRCRMLQQQSSLAEAFEMQERDMGHVQAELKLWRRDNLKLELRGKLDTVISKRRLTEARREADDLLSRVWDLQKQQRQHALQMGLKDKVISSTSADLRSMNERLSGNEREIVDSRLGLAALEARTFRAEAALADMTRARDELLEERQRTHDEVTSMKVHMANLDSQKRQDAVVNRMRSKHGRRGGGGSGGAAGSAAGPRGGKRRAADAPASAAPAPSQDRAPVPPHSSDGVVRAVTATLKQLGGEITRATDMRRAVPVLTSLHSKLSEEVRELQGALRESEERQDELLAHLVEVSV